MVFNRKFRETFVSTLTRFSFKSGEQTSGNENKNSREGLKLLKIENTSNKTESQSKTASTCL